MSTRTVVAVFALSVAPFAIGCGGDVAARLDASSPASDASAPLSDADTCVRYSIPGSASEFSPQYVPPPPSTNVCTKGAIQQALTSCIDSGAACDAFKSQEATCYGCLFAAGGPFERTDVGVFRNHGGCVELVDGTTGAQSCGGLQRALDQCEFVACSSAKTVDECRDVVTTKLTDPTCGPKAATTICKVYAKSVGGCADGLPQCFGTDEALAGVFCAAP